MFKNSKFYNLLLIINDELLNKINSGYSRFRSANTLLHNAILIGHFVISAYLVKTDAKLSI